MATLAYMKQLQEWLYSWGLPRTHLKCGHLKQLGVRLYSLHIDLLRDLCSELLLKCRGGMFQGQETQFQTRIERGSLTTCIYIVTPNRSEIKHYGGAVLQGGGYHV